MKFLIDNSKFNETYADFVAGQLLTPLTNYRNWSPDYFAIDNGAFSGFKLNAFRRLLNRQEPNRAGCQFVCVPDVVGNARRTLEIWERRHEVVDGWPLALVAQDGLEDLSVPWGEFECLFIGGTNEFKSSAAAWDLIQTAKILKKHVHIGRVNSSARFENFADVADTCDGSGVSRGLCKHFQRIIGGRQNGRLFD